MMLLRRRTVERGPFFLTLTARFGGYDMTKPMRRRRCSSSGPGRRAADSGSASHSSVKMRHSPLSMRGQNSMCSAVIGHRPSSGGSVLSLCELMFSVFRFFSRPMLGGMKSMLSGRSRCSSVTGRSSGGCSMSRWLVRSRRLIGRPVIGYISVPSFSSGLYGTWYRLLECSWARVVMRSPFPVRRSGFIFVKSMLVVIVAAGAGGTRRRASQSRDPPLRHRR
mmetsp:Transcript_25249/g.88078  ORF Transcript_25249/g.88078 Transcript_25249/m.88078 type:complete len:222 (-) Transcript_25249:293-958(-)